MTNVGDGNAVDIQIRFRIPIARADIINEINNFHVFPDLQVHGNLADFHTQRGTASAEVRDMPIGN